jgi:hypothetical protein
VDQGLERLMMWRNSPAKCGVHIAHRIGGYDVKVIEEGRTA